MNFIDCSPKCSPLQWDFNKTDVTNINSVPISPTQYWDKYEFKEQYVVPNNKCDNVSPRNPVAENLLANWNEDLDYYFELLNSC